MNVKNLIQYLRPSHAKTRHACCDYAPRGGFHLHASDHADLVIAETGGMQQSDHRVQSCSWVSMVKS